MSRALAPVEQAIGTWKSAIAARNAYQRVKTQLDEMPVRGEAMPLPAPKGRLQVEGVSHFYPGISEATLRNINLTIEPGEAPGMRRPPHENTHRPAARSECRRHSTFPAASARSPYTD